MTYEELLELHPYLKEMRIGLSDDDETLARCVFESCNKQVESQKAVINFLKKELQKKTYCRQVMKRQYRELKQKYEALKNKEKV
ncbi:MAG: hypothetical protein J6V90_08310 [Treponema sp.]|nr:hypothetical protein [Treponema sp.]